MATVRVFYSWSSDNDHRTCRGLIHDALAMACEQLTAELEEAGRPVELDHDTKGATGSPAITETIEKKIRECDVFVADLTPTHVQTRGDGSARIIPNPNVMYELGYAYRSVGSDRIITVLNTAFAEGARKDERLIVDGALPFNLRHRSYPECYELLEDADRPTLRKERALFVKQLFKKIKPIAEQAPTVVGPKYEPQQPIEGRVATFLKNGEVLLIKHGSKTEWRDELQQIYVRFIPETAVHLTNLTLEQAATSELSSIPPHSTNDGNSGLNKYGFVNCSVKALPDDIVISRDMLQFFKSGEVWGVFGGLLLRDPDNVSWLVEDLFTWGAANIAIFADAVDLRGPGQFVFGITGLEGRNFLYPTTGSTPFHQDTFRYEQDVDSCERKIVRKVAEAAAENLWAEAGLKRPKILSTPEWRQENYYPRYHAYWHLFETESE